MTSYGSFNNWEKENEHKSRRTENGGFLTLVNQQKQVIPLGIHGKDKQITKEYRALFITWPNGRLSA